MLFKIEEAVKLGLNYHNTFMVTNKSVVAKQEYDWEMKTRPKRM